MAGLKAVVAGAGIGEYHIQGYQAAGVEVAICDINFKRAKDLGAKYGIYAYDDLEFALKDFGAGIASICLPNALHHDTAIACLQAGTHVLCEKPPAINTAQAVDMRDVAVAAGPHLSWVLNNRFRPEVVELKKMVDDGAIGPVQRARAMWLRNCGIPGWGGWFTNRDMAGGGAAIDLGIHMLDLVMWLQGYPDVTEVMGETWSTFGPLREKLGPWGKPLSKKAGKFNVEDMASGFIRLSTGAVIEFGAGWAGNIEHEFVEASLFGQKAGATLLRIFGHDGVDDSSIDSLRVFTGSTETGPVVTPVEIGSDPAMGRIEGVRQFAEAMMRGEKPPVDVEHGLRLMQIIDAIYKSAGQGESVLEDTLEPLEHVEV